MTLLELVQTLLSDIDSDDVNSIEDTGEAMQIARIVRSTFQDICTEYYLESNKELTQLESLVDANHPTHLRIPDGVYSIESFEYNVSDSNGDPPRWKRLLFLEPMDFLNRVTHNDDGSTNIQIVDEFGGAQIQVRKDVQPTCYTSFDNQYVVLDAWKQDVVSTVVGSRTRVVVSKKPSLELEDDEVIDLPEHLESLLTAESRVLAFEMFKDGAPAQVQRIALRQRVRAQRIKHSIKERRPSDQLPDYGRRV